jgi:hypothetical protein
MKHIPLLPGLIFLLAAALTGCASGGGKMLRITSEPDSARVLVFDRLGNLAGETATPASFAVKDEYSYIEVSSDGYRPQKIVIGQDIKKRFNPLYLLNFAVAAGGAGAGIALNRAGGESHLARTASYYMFGIGALGLLGAILDPLAGSTSKISPNEAHVVLQAAP